MAEGITTTPELVNVELAELDAWKTRQLKAADATHKETRAKVHEHYRTERKRLVKLLDWLEAKASRPNSDI